MCKSVNFGKERKTYSPRSDDMIFETRSFTKIIRGGSSF